MAEKAQFTRGMSERKDALFGNALFKTHLNMSWSTGQMQCSATWLSVFVLQSSFQSSRQQLLKTIARETTMRPKKHSSAQHLSSTAATGAWMISNYTLSVSVPSLSRSLALLLSTDSKIQTADKWESRYMATECAFTRTSQPLSDKCFLFNKVSQ